MKEQRDGTSLVAPSASLIGAEVNARDAAERAIAQLEDVLDSMSDAFYAYDHELRITRTNRAARETARRNGIDPTRMIGELVWDVFPGLESTDIGAALRRCGRERTPVTLEQYGPYSRRWLEMQFNPTAEGIAVYVHDISGRKRAELVQRLLGDAGAALSSSLDREATLAVVADLVVPTLADWLVLHLFDEGGKLEPVLTKHFDATKSEAVAAYHRLYPADDDASVPRGVALSGASRLYAHLTDEVLAASARGDGHLDLMHSLGVRSAMIVPVAAAGQQRFGSMSLIGGPSRPPYDEDDLRVAEELGRRIALTLDNVTLLAKARAAADRTARLQEATAAFARALTAEQAAGVVLTQGLAALSAGAGVVYLLDRDSDTLRATAWHGIPEAAFAQWMSVPIGSSMLVSDAVRTGKPIYAPSREETLDKYPSARIANRLVQQDAWAALPLIQDGEPLGALALGFSTRRGFSADDRALIEAVAQQCAQALERARLFDAERAARAHADDANRAKTEFLAVMSHELRTPLNAIAGYAELLDIGVHGPLTDAQRESIERIQRSQRHLLGLINDVLNFARIEAGRVEIDIRAFPLHEALSALETLVAPLLEKKQLRYRYQPCAPETTVNADAEKVRQILLNLLSNAIKFTEASGEILIFCRSDADSARISVSDTGRGIPADKLERIFEPFVQLDVGRTRTHEGTGLGLSISRDLARAMGGDLSAESVVDQGSTFSLRLPLAAR